MLHWCPTRELCEERGQEEGWAININKTLGQLFPRSSSSISLMQGLKIQHFFLRGSIWLRVGGHTKGPQKGDRNLLLAWPEIAHWRRAEAKGQEAIPGGLGEAFVRGVQALLAWSPEGLLVAEKGSKGTFSLQEIWDSGFIFMLSTDKGSN